MSATKHTAEPWKAEASNRIVSTDTGWGIGECFVTTAQPLPLASANAARIVQCINACAKFPDPAAALTDLRALLGQARGLLAEGDTDRADKMLVAALGVLDGEDV